MISIALPSLRTATAAQAAPAFSMIATRHLSMTCTQSVHKLNTILEEYRAKNYTQCFPRRFQKDIVKAATVHSRQLNVYALDQAGSGGDGVSAEGIENVLHNIGAGHRMSRDEIEGILSEVGVCAIGDDGERCVISANQMLDLMSKNWEDHHHELNQPLE